MISEIVVPSPNAAFKSIRTGIVPCDFLIANGEKTYKCHHVVIAACAKKLLPMFENDPGLRRIDLNIPDPMDVLSQIIDFFYGYDMTITPANVNSSFLLSYRFGVIELIQASSEVLKKLFTFSTVVPSLLFINQNQGDISLHIDFIRENFNDIKDQNDIMELPISVLSKILSSNDIDIPNEDSLAIWLSILIKRRGVEAAGLVDTLHLANVSNNAVLELCSLKEINAPSLLETSKKMHSLPPGSYPERHYHSSADDVETLKDNGTFFNVPLPEQCSIDGIISKILNESNELMPIKVTASSIHDKYFMPQNVLALTNTHSCWYSSFSPDQWIMFDFSPRAIKPTEYTLRTSGGSRGEGHLKNWKIMASNDLHEWDQIDERRMNNALNGMSKIATFSCSCNQFYKYIKIIQIDMNHHKDYSFILSACEFFGNYVEPKKE